MSDTNNKIINFFEECNNLLKDITLEWIREDEQIGEIINGNQILKYEKYNVQNYNNISSESNYYNNYKYNEYHKYRLQSKINNHNNFTIIGFVDINDYYDKQIFVNYYNSTLIKAKDTFTKYDIYANKIEFKDYVDKYLKYNNLLSLICIILNAIDYKFFKFINDKENKENNQYNLINGITCKNINEQKIIYYKCIQNYKKLQIKYKNKIIFQMINLNTSNYPDTIFKCIYNNTNKIIEFILFDKKEYNYFCYNDNNNRYYSKQIDNYLDLYGIRVFYNVKYSLENNLIKQVSEISKNQEFIKEQNIQNLLLEKNQEIEELKNLLNKKSKYEDLQELIQKNLFSTLNDFKEKYEEQLKINQEEFNKIKNEHIDNYHNSLLKINSSTNELTNKNEELKNENEELKNKNEELKNKIYKLNNNIENYMIKNNKLNNYTDMLNKYIIEMINIYKENYENKNEKTDKENEAIKDEESDEDTEEAKDEKIDKKNEAIEDKETDEDAKEAKNEEQYSINTLNSFKSNFIKIIKQNKELHNKNEETDKENDTKENDTKENEKTEDEENNATENEETYKKQYSINTLNSFKSNFIKIIIQNKELNDKNKNNEQLINILKSKNNKLLFEIEKINENNKHNLKNELIQNSENKFNTLNLWLTNNDINQYININDIPNININNNTLEELLDKAKEYYNYISIKNMTYNEFKLYLKYILKIDHTKY